MNKTVNNFLKNVDGPPQMSRSRLLRGRNTLLSIAGGFRSVQPYFKPDSNAGNQIFSKILLHGWKSSLISAARPHTSEGSEDEVDRNIKKFALTANSEQVYVRFAGETGEADREVGNVLIVLGLQIGSILSRLN